MKSLLLTFLILMTFVSSYAQLIDKKAIDNRVDLIDTTAGRSKARVYVINGVPFNDQDSIRIDSALNSYDPKYLVDVNFVTCR